MKELVIRKKLALAYFACIGVLGRGAAPPAAAAFHLLGKLALIHLSGSSLTSSVFCHCSSCILNPEFGQICGRFDFTRAIAFATLHLCFFIRYAITDVALREIPAMLPHPLASPVHEHHALRLVRFL